MSYFSVPLNNDTANPQPIAVDLIDNTYEKYKIEINQAYYPDGGCRLGWELFFNSSHSLWKRLKQACRYLFKMENGSIGFSLDRYQIRALRELVVYSIEKWEQSVE